MIKQTAISVKMDAVTLEDLNEECNKFGKKRNRCINIAVQQWVERQDKERQDTYWRSVGGSSYDEKALELGKYILCNLTDKENFQVRFIANGTGTDSEKVLLQLIKRGLEDFDQRPFSYL